MNEKEILQRFAYFLEHPIVQERGELELASYLGWYIGTKMGTPTPINADISQDVPFFVSHAMRDLCSPSGNTQIQTFSRLYLAARGFQSLPSIYSHTPEMDFMIDLSSRILGKVTGNTNLVEDIIVYCEGQRDFEDIKGILKDMRSGLCSEPHERSYASTDDLFE